MEIEVPSDREQIILDVIDLFLLSQDINVLHLRSGQLIEGFNKFFLELESIFIFSEISQALVH